MNEAGRRRVFGNITPSQAAEYTWRGAGGMVPEQLKFEAHTHLSIGGKKLDDVMVELEADRGHEPRSPQQNRVGMPQ